MLCDLEEPTVNNRGFRKLEIDKILQVKFRDDDLSWFPRNLHILKDAMLTPFIKGLHIRGRQFFSFAASSSSFREHGQYFYAARNQEEIVEIIESWGEFKVEPAVKTAAMQPARVGQFFTSAKVTPSIQLRFLSFNP